MSESNQTSATSRAWGGVKAALPVVVNIVVVVVLVGGTFWLTGLTRTAPVSCGPSPDGHGGHVCGGCRITSTHGGSSRSATGARAKGRRRPSRVQVTVASRAGTTFLLGHDVDAGRRSIPLRTSAPLHGEGQIAVDVSDFVPVGGGRDLVPRDIAAWVKRDPSGRSPTLFVCVRPDRRPALPSGTYTGHLTLDNARLNRLSVPVTISLSYTHVETVIRMGLLVCFAASLYVFYLRRPDLLTTAAENELEREAALRWPFTWLFDYWRFVTSPVGLITIAAGLVSAFTAFAIQYLKADAWSNDPQGWFAFCGAVATAFIAGGTAGKLAQNQYNSSSQKKAPKAPAKQDQGTGVTLT